MSLEKKERTYTKSEIINIIEASKPKKEYLHDGHPRGQVLENPDEYYEGFNNSASEYEANLKKELK